MYIDTENNVSRMPSIFIANTPSIYKINRFILYQTCIPKYINNNKILYRRLLLKKTNKHRKICMYVSYGSWIVCFSTTCTAHKMLCMNQKEGIFFPYFVYVYYYFRWYKNRHDNNNNNSCIPFEVPMAIQ